MTRPVAVVHERRTPFVQWDLEWLRGTTGAREVFWPLGHWKTNTLRTGLGVARSRASLSWFAGLHAVVASATSTALRHPAVVVIGGHDVANEPKLGYGLLRKSRERRIVARALRLATTIAPVDEGLCADIERHLPETYRAVADKIHVVPTGFSADLCRPARKRNGRVLMVAAASPPSRALVKGLPLFMDVARRCPDVAFELFGVTSDELQPLGLNVPTNVELVGTLAHDEVLRRLEHASGYIQTSRREGLPTALCEAMLAGCHAVGTDVQGIRGVLASTGTLAGPDDAEALAAAVQRAAAQRRPALEARQSILARFPMQERQRALALALGLDEP